jgi:hypothetical protein
MPTIPNEDIHGESRRMRDIPNEGIHELGTSKLAVH